MHILLFLIFIFSGIVSIDVQGQKKTAVPEPLLPAPTPEQLAWHKMEMNAFIHFTTNTFTDKEWGYGDEEPSVFNPSACNPSQWVKTLKESGFKGIILTAKHHDGFTLWPSRYTTHSIKNSPYKSGQGDIVKEVSESCRKNKMKFGIYLSPWDRNHPDYGRVEYINYYRNQLKELFTDYGPVFEMWFDGANGGDGYYGGAKEKRRIDGSTYYEWPATLRLIQEIQPKLLFFSDAGPHIRWVGNEAGSAGETNWNTINIDTLYAGKPNISELLNSGSETGDKWVPAEVDVSIRPGWFYHSREDSLVKTPEELFTIYLSSVGRGSLLLLNVPPDRRGVLHEKDIAALQGFKQLLTERLGRNLAKNASVKADSYRHRDKMFAPVNIADEREETYWSTDDAITTGTLEITLSGKKEISYILLQEYIKLGQRVKSFKIDIWKNDGWSTVGNGSTIGYKRIVKIDPVKTDKIRLSILASKACPLISNVAVY